MATFFLPLFTAAALLAVPPADISGAWDLLLKADWTSIPALTCTIVQKDSAVTGTCKSAGDPDEHSVKITDGKIDGARIHVTWQVRTPDGEGWIYTLNGTVDEAGTSMKGGFKVSGRVGGGEGTFTAAIRASE